MTSVDNRFAIKYTYIMDPIQVAELKKHIRIGLSPSMFPCADGFFTLANCDTDLINCKAGFFTTFFKTSSEY